MVEKFVHFVYLSARLVGDTAPPMEENVFRLRCGGGPSGQLGRKWIAQRHTLPPNIVNVSGGPWKTCVGGSIIPCPPDLSPTSRNPRIGGYVGSCLTASGFGSPLSQWFSPSALFPPCGLSQDVFSAVVRAPFAICASQGDVVACAVWGCCTGSCDICG